MNEYQKEISDLKAIIKQQADVDSMVLNVMSGMAETMGELASRLEVLEGAKRHLDETGVQFLRRQAD